MSGGVRFQQPFTNGIDYGSSLVGGTSATPVVASASTNARGAWTLLGVLAIDASLLRISLFPIFANNGFCEIGFGPSGSQEVFLGPLVGRLANSADFFVAVDFPAHTSIWARVQSATASSTWGIKFTSYSGGVVNGAGERGGDAFGINLGNSLGTAIATPSTANTKSGWSQLSASTPNEYSECVIAAVALQTAVPFLLDMAIGASGAERVILPNFGPLSSVAQVNWVMPFPLQIPKGSRLCARAQSSSATQTVYVTFVGLYR
jgi:hypothetical protein